ncbi:MAG TPA: hypothetical protein VI456_17275 [Polyangia bacterium]
MAIQQPRWGLLAAAALAAVALAAAVPRAARAQTPEWTSPVYRPPPPASPVPASPVPATPSDAASAQPPPQTPGWAPGYGPPVYVPPTYVPPPAGPVHGGLFLRLHLGLGLNSYSASGGSTQISGGGVSVAVALGYGIVPNLALYGTFFESVAGQPGVKTDRTDLAAAGGGAVAGLGGGAVYYVEPINLYVSGAIASTFLIIEDARGNTIDQTHVGIGFQAMVGKEWWVSQHWGLGAAFEIIAATSMKDNNDPSVSWTAEASNLVFSATYY